MLRKAAIYNNKQYLNLTTRVQKYNNKINYKNSFDVVQLEGKKIDGYKVQKILLFKNEVSVCRMSILAVGKMTKHDYNLYKL